MATSPTVSGSSGSTSVSGAAATDSTSGASSVSGSAAAPAADKPASLELIVALFLTDWLHGDRHHAELLQKHALKLLADLGEDGAEARLRLEAETTLA